MCVSVAAAVHEIACGATYCLPGRLLRPRATKGTAFRIICFRQLKVPKVSTFGPWHQDDPSETLVELFPEAVLD
jgi:hypothetical protein